MGYGDPKAEPIQGTGFLATFTVYVGHSNGDFRSIVIKDSQGRPWAHGSIPFRALREARDEYQNRNRH